MKTGDREFADRLHHADTITITENWAGWSVHAYLRHIDVVNIGPFRNKRDAVTWLHTWLPEPRPLTCNEPGAWAWHAT